MSETKRSGADDAPVPPSQQFTNTILHYKQKIKNTLTYLKDLENKENEEQPSKKITSISQNSERQARKESQNSTKHQENVATNEAMPTEEQMNDQNSIGFRSQPIFNNGYLTQQQTAQSCTSQDPIFIYKSQCD